MFSLQKIRHMKYYALLLICFVTSLAYSQKANSNDTLFLKDNTIYTGKINKEDLNQYQFILSGTQKIVYVLKSDIVRIGYQLTSSSNTQSVGNDTIYLKNNTSYVGNLLNEEWKMYEFVIIGTKKIVSIPKDSVLRVARHKETWKQYQEGFPDWKKDATDAKVAYVNRFDTLSFEGLRLEVKQIKLQSIITREHLKTAGQCGIAGGVLSLGGTILSVVGAVTGKPTLTYVGAGLAGTGLILNFVAFGNLIKAGKRNK